MAKSEATPTRSTRQSLRSLQMESSFIVFSLIYFPVSLLFNGRGLVASAMLVLYTIALVLAAVLLMMRFVLFVARSANEHTGRYGTVLIMYMLNMFVPLLTLKFVAHEVWEILPCTCGRWGLFADAVHMVREMYFVFDIQNNLTLLATASLVLVSVFTFWSIRKHK